MNVQNSFQYFMATGMLNLNLVKGFDSSVGKVKLLEDKTSILSPLPPREMAVSLLVSSVEQGDPGTQKQQKNNGTGAFLSPVGMELEDVLIANQPVQDSLWPMLLYYTLGFFHLRNRCLAGASFPI